MTNFILDLVPRREKERGKTRPSTSRSHSPNIYARETINTTRSMPTMQLAICKVCGNVMNNVDRVEQRLLNNCLNINRDCRFFL